MKTSCFTIAALAAFAFASPVLAEGDIAKGEKAFNQCQTCHVVVDPEGNVLAGRKAITGPNLYGVFGRAAGSYPGFKYGKDMIAAGEKGLVWDEEHFATYVRDPSAFLKDYLDDKKAKGIMAFKLKKTDDPADLYAYIASLSPAAPAADAAAPAADAAPAPAVTN
ncbi:c-type cytochrome [Paracoccaceae bacterium Fryx2]|nr:c-type cytochrome [Paracoccaceae bacterium Fryx2]